MQKHSESIFQIPVLYIKRVYIEFTVYTIPYNRRNKVNKKANSVPQCVLYFKFEKQLLIKADFINHIKINHINKVKIIKSLKSSYIQFVIIRGWIFRVYHEGKEGLQVYIIIQMLVIRDVCRAKN